MTVHVYEVVGRAFPSDKETEPKVFKMRVFAPNAVRARNVFWAFMCKQQKVKKTSGQLLACRRIYERRPDTVKNFGISIRYNSRTGVHNMYKEYRDTSLENAMEAMYEEMAGRHRAFRTNIQVLNTCVMHGSEARRAHVTQYINQKIRFPITHRVIRAPFKKLNSKFVASRPSTFA